MHFFYEVGGKLNLSFILQRANYNIPPKLMIIERRLQLAAIPKYSLNHHLDRLKDEIKHLKQLTHVASSNLSSIIVELLIKMKKNPCLLIVI